MLLYKNVIIQIMKNRVFVFLLWILNILTSLSYFFVKFSIDGNMDLLQSKEVLQENEILWKNALKNNTSLANIFLLATTLLTCFVFAMFFYRFSRANKVQIGCVKALGMKNRELLACFCGFSMILSLAGGVLGVGIGYFLSDVLLQAYMQSYSVTEVIKEIHTSSLLLGCGVPMLAYVGVVSLCFLMIKGKETGVLLAGRVPYKKLGTAFHMADAVTSLIPAKKKFPFRIALRKPVAIVLMLVAIMVFQVCVILGQSLNLSSQKVMQSQMQGHNYEYDIRMDSVMNGEAADEAMPYLYHECEVVLMDKDVSIAQTLIGLYGENDMFIPKNDKGEEKGIILTGEVYTNVGLADMYGVKIGDELKLNVNGVRKSFQVVDIIENAKTASLYCNAEDLAALMGCENGSYNGLWSLEKMDVNGLVESKEQRIERLEKDAVSNKISAVINQLTGVLIGIILLFLALFINFQDNQRDMDILRLIGYQNKEIRRLFVDVYWPIVVFFFLVGAVPSIMIAKAIQKGLSLSIQDYMPFGINIMVFVLMFLMMCALYGCVWGIFARRMILKGARQVGKTWLMKEFGKKHFKYTAYVNFDNNKHMEDVFNLDYDIERIIMAINIETGAKIIPSETLIIFDEIQENPRAIAALKYFYENAPEYAIITASSLLGVAIHKGVSFPVGKVDTMELNPLSFREFLLAMGESGLVELIDTLNLELLEAYHDKYVDWLKKYYYIGGMPEVVESFVENKDFVEVRYLQNKIIELYEDDFSKHTTENELPRIRMVWNSIPMQLAKENKKFFFGKIKEGARAKDFEIAIEWLQDCGLIKKVYKVSKPAVPLKAYIDFSSFKLFLLDVGLLGA